MSVAQQPIAVFDSGLGGLSVLKSCLARMPSENFIYLGDTARLPYGSKSAETILRYVQQNVNFLATHKPKAIVVACNSASTVLSALAPEKNLGLSNLFGFEGPVYNVIEPGCQTALHTGAKRIGLLGTKATVASQVYLKLLKKLDAKIEVFANAAPLLVPLVEEGWLDDPLTNLVIHRYIQPLLHHNIESLILGCTHYPFLRSSFKKVLGSSVSLVDSAIAIAEKIGQDLDSGVLAKNPNVLASQTSSPIEIYCTDAGNTFQSMASQLLAPITTAPIRWVDIAPISRDA